GRRENRTLLRRSRSCVSANQPELLTQYTYDARAFVVANGDLIPALVMPSIWQLSPDVRGNRHLNGQLKGVVLPVPRQMPHVAGVRSKPYSCVGTVPQQVRDKANCIQKRSLVAGVGTYQDHEVIQWSRNILQRAKTLGLHKSYHLWP